MEGFYDSRNNDSTRQLLLKWIIIYRNNKLLNKIQMNSNLTTWNQGKEWVKQNTFTKNLSFCFWAREQETDIIEVGWLPRNGSFLAPLSNLYVRSIWKVWNNVRSRKKVSYTWWRCSITNTSLLWGSYFQWYFNYIFHDIFNDISIIYFMIFSMTFVLAFWICWFGGVRGKLNLKSSSNLSAFHLPFPISKIYSYNRS